MSSTDIMTAPLILAGDHPRSPASPNRPSVTEGEAVTLGRPTPGSTGRPPGNRQGRTPSATGAPPQANDACTADRHGDAPAYRLGCRCPDACEAYRVQSKRARQRRRRGLPARPHHITAVGTGRRIRALRAMGHPTTRIAAELGVRRQWITHLSQLDAGDLVDVSTARRVCALYDAWAMTPGGDRRAAERAKQLGYVPPLAWDDDTIDDPAARPNRGHNLPSVVDRQAVHLAVGGVPVRLRPAELHQAVSVLTRQGLSARLVAERLDIAPRSVTRRRAASR